jgi:hypothetical protein
MKKQKLNHQLYHAQLKAAQEWNTTWPLISEHTHTIINSESTRKYKTLQYKLERLTLHQTKIIYNPTEFYPRVVNNTNITFTNEELSLLNQGPKYNLHFKHKQWIQTLALEAQNAITMLPTHEQEPTRHAVTRNIKHESCYLLTPFRNVSTMY